MSEKIIGFLFLSRLKFQENELLKPMSREHYLLVLGITEKKKNTFY